MNKFFIGDVGKFDYIIVGGGIVGCVIVSCFFGYLLYKWIFVIEGGFSDVGDICVLIFKDCI